MMASIGSITIYIILITTMFALVTALIGKQTGQQWLTISSRTATLFSSLVTVISAAILLYALIISDFNFAYVADYTSYDLPLIFKVSALWAGQSGSMLLWLLLLSVITFLLQVSQRIRQQADDIILLSLLNLIRLIFIVFILALDSPFLTLKEIPSDGAGLNPILQSFEMVVHPPFLFLGYSGFAVPFALVSSSLLKRDDADWASSSRPWILFSWLMLTVGMVTGANWAYSESGWGGYWAWDPVENASLFPWLTSSALLHTLILQRQNRGMKLWNYLLISATFMLTIFSTFITRSGVIDSVHGFNDTEVGEYFWGVIIVIMIFTVYLLLSRFHQLKDESRELKFFSKETGLIITNILLMMIFIGVFIGTIFPLISPWFLGRRGTVDQMFYNQVTIPLWLSLVFLLGVCPVLNWRQTERKRIMGRLIIPIAVEVVTGILLLLQLTDNWLALLSLSSAAFGVTVILQDFVIDCCYYKFKYDLRLLVTPGRCFRHGRKRYGAYIIHLGIIVILIGITGSIFKTELTTVIDPGERFQLGLYTLKYTGLIPEYTDRYIGVSAQMEVYRGDRFEGTVRSEKLFYPQYSQPVTRVGILGNLREDICFTLVGWKEDRAQIQIILHPLTIWVWIGSYLLYLGIVVILWPNRKLKK